MRTHLAKFSLIFESGAVDRWVNLEDLVKSFQTSIYYLVFTIYLHLLAKIGVDTAENGPLKYCQKLTNSYKKS